MKKVMGFLAASCAVAGLSACGGSDGGDGATGIGSAAKLDSPDAAAAMFIAALDIGEGLDQFNAKSGVGYRAKAVETSECDQGSVSFDDATGRTQYNNCLFQDTFESYSFRSLMNGVTVDACADGGWSENTDCMGRYVYQMGEGGRPFTAELSDSDGLDVALSALLTVQETETFADDSETYVSEQNGRLSIEDREEFAGKVSVEFSEFVVSETYIYSSGRSEITINGSAGTDAGNVFTNCNTGTVSFQTIAPIVRDEAQDIALSGELRISNSAGDSATLVIQDDVLTVTANGVSQSYTQEELDGFCG